MENAELVERKSLTISLKIQVSSSTLVFCVLVVKKTSSSLSKLKRKFQLGKVREQHT